MDAVSGGVRTNDGTLVVLPSATARAYVAFALSIPPGILAVIAATTTQSVVPAIAVAAVGLVVIVRAAARPRLLIDRDQVVIVNAIRTWRIPPQDVEAIGWRYTLCLSDKLRHGPPAIVFTRRGKLLAPPAHATALLSEEQRRLVVAELTSKTQPLGIAVTLRAENLQNRGGN